MINVTDIVALAWIVFVLVSVVHSTPMLTETVFKKRDGFISRVILCPKCLGFELSLVLTTLLYFANDVSPFKAVVSWFITWPSAGALALIFHMLLFDWFLDTNIDFDNSLDPVKDIDCLASSSEVNDRSNDDNSTSRS